MQINETVPALSNAASGSTKHRKFHIKGCSETHRRFRAMVIGAPLIRAPLIGAQITQCGHGRFALHSGHQFLNWPSVVHNRGGPSIEIV